MLSNGIFLVFGVMFELASLGFCLRGETEMARAFIISTLLAGVFLLILAAGLFYGTWESLAGFDAAFSQDTSAVTLLCAGLILFLNGPVWRASLITAIAMLTLIIVVASTANARLAANKDNLLMARATQWTV